MYRIHILWSNDRAPALTAVLPRWMSYEIFFLFSSPDQSLFRQTYVKRTVVEVQIQFL